MTVMRNPLRPIVALIFLGILIACASPRPNGSNAGLPVTSESTGLIDPNAVDALHILPGPPALHSPESDADFAVLKQRQLSRTKAECRRARAEERSDHFLEFFRAPRGPLLPGEVERLNPFFERVLAEARPIWTKGKKYWARPRPYVTDPSLHPCVAPENTFAYPSGHAGGGELFADLLADLFPERERSIRDRGFEIGEDRILGGVHHPTDVRDGRLLADLTYAAFKMNSNFGREFRELRSKIGKP